MLLLQDVKFFKELTAQWLTAWQLRDRELLESHLSEDFLFFSSLNKSCIDKTEWLHIILECYQLDTWEIEFLNIKSHDNTCIIVYKLSMRVKPNYTGEPEKYIVSDVWSFASDNWKFVFHEPLPV